MHPKRFPHDPMSCNTFAIMDQDLPLLRADATGELVAIVTYRRFLGEAKHPIAKEALRHALNAEIGHYIQLMRMIANLDPPQADALQEHKLDWVLCGSLMVNAPMPHFAGTDLRSRITGDTPPVLADGVTPAHLHDISAAADDLDRLNMAIEMEFTPINEYQEHIAMAIHDEVKALLAGIMNAEKHHVAHFMRAMVDIAHEHHDDHHEGHDHD